MPGDDLYCRHPFCQLLSDHDADWILVCKHSFHKCLHDCLHGSLRHSSPRYAAERSASWLRVRNSKIRIELLRYRWQ